MDGMFQDSMANDLPMSPKLVHTYAIRQLHVDVRMKRNKENRIQHQRNTEDDRF